MPAWRLKKLWEAQDISDYRDWVAREGPRKAGSARCTCEDLSIRLVTEIALHNGLPIFFANGAHPFPGGITPESYLTPGAFLEETLTSTGARDLADYHIAKRVAGTARSDPSSLRSAQPGDLIMLYEPIGHVQVVTDAGTSAVKIAQGNFRPKGERAGWTDKLGGANQNNPTDPYYIGAIVAEKSHVLEVKSGKWIYDGKSEVFKDDYGQLMTWDFDAWNSRIVTYTVKAGDTYSSIAQSVYNDVQPFYMVRVIESVNHRLDGKGLPRPGLVLYLWR